MSASELKSRAQLEEIANVIQKRFTERSGYLDPDIVEDLPDGRRKTTSTLVGAIADALEAVQREAETQLALSKKREKILREGLIKCDALYADDGARYRLMREVIKKADEVK